MIGWKLPLGITGGAVERGPYRYVLRREGYGGNAGRLCVVMLNPSTAGAAVDDKTSRMCSNWAHAWNHSALDIVNLFAHRATQPADLWALASGSRIGPENDKHLVETMERADRVLLAWGRQPHALPRLKQLAPVLNRYELACVATTKEGGWPVHPSRRRNDESTRPYDLEGFLRGR